MPPIVTPEALLKFVPTIVIVVSLPPLLGVNAVILGALIKVNDEVEVAVPPGVVTEIVPVLPVPIIAVIVSLFTTLNDCALVPPIVTPEALLKFVPIIVTIVPLPPLFGVNDIIAGAGINVNLLLLVAVPPGVDTEM